MRGITPVIAVILLLLITISLVGFAFVFLTRTTETAAESGEQQLEQQLQQFGAQFVIEAISENKIYIRNVGSTLLRNFQVYIDGSAVGIKASDIPQNSVGTIEFNRTRVDDGGHDIKITSSGASDSKSQSITFFNGFTNGGFESGSGSSADSWPSDADCGDNLCYYRTTTNAISGYSWYAKGPAGSWHLVMEQRVPYVDRDGAKITLEFDYLCVTATSPNGYGWHMRFRAYNSCPTGCIDISTVGTAYIGGTTQQKDMTNFLCSASERGRFVGTMTMPSDNNDYWWYMWDYSAASTNQEIIIDNIKVYPTF